MKYQTVFAYIAEAVFCYVNFARPDGKQYTEYEASQIQRYHERKIRRWKRENVAMSAAGQDTYESAAKIRSWEERQKDFLRQTGLKRQGDREQVAGFGRSEA